MSKIFYISAIIIGLGFISCNKQNRCPNDEDDRQAPSWDCTDKSVNDEGDITIDGNIDDGNPITDPNNDPDGKKPKP